MIQLCSRLPRSTVQLLLLYYWLLLTVQVPTTPATDDVLNIVSSPMVEGSANGDGEESYHLSDADYNCTQIFRKDIILTGSALAINILGNVDNQINRQTAFALGETARDLNRVALFGRRIQALLQVQLAK